MKKVYVKGVIISDEEQWIYDYFEIPACSPNKINKVLTEANGDDVEIIINSGGGSVNSGSEIYTMLKDYKGKTVGKITGMAGSSASIISMGVDNLLISPTAQIMIHRASMYAGGNAGDMDKAQEILSQCDKSIANAYMLKTGMKQEELLNLMEKETFMTAQEAKKYGFVDEIMFAENNDIKLVASINNTGMLPQNVINKMKNKIISDKQKQQKENEELELAQARLRLLDL